MLFIHTTTSNPDSLTVAPCIPPQGHSATPPATGHTRRTQRPDGRSWIGLAVRSDQQRDDNLILDRVRMFRFASCSTAELAAKTPSSLGSLRHRNRRGSIAMTITTHLQIACEDESLCLRSTENAFRLFAAATSSSTADDPHKLYQQSPSRKKSPQVPKPAGASAAGRSERPDIRRRQFLWHHVEQASDEWRLELAIVVVIMHGVY